MIINSLLDSDLYKFTMQQIVLHRFPAANVEYIFKCRNSANLSQYIDEIREEIKNLEHLTLKKVEANYMRSQTFFTDDFVDFLTLFRFNNDYVTITDAGDGTIDIRVKGPWLHTILFEVPILAIVNEVYSRNEFKKQGISSSIAMENLQEKIDLVKRYNESDLSLFSFADFGTRRRFTAGWQDVVVQTLKEELPLNLAGTSNVHLARRHKIKPIGTMAHEFIQAAQALGPRLIDSQKFAFENWAQEYRGQLGIALSDCMGMDAFLRDFDLYFCKLFDGARHDSGDPEEWCRKLMLHYEGMGIEPMTKTAVFSDGLNFPLALHLSKTFDGLIRTSFGIGTNLTNDVGLIPLQIVMKMILCNGQPVAKISDSSGKQMCLDDDFLEYLSKVYQVVRRDK
jgi:nicotinate phosphoribosyltransferase